MFIRAVIKKDKKKDKSYTYYRLTHSYRVGNKVRQIVILNLGKLDGLSQTDRQLLANRLEEIITGKPSLFSDTQYSAIEDLAQEFARKVAKDKIYPSSKGKSIAKDVNEDFQTVDLQTIEQLQSKSIGAEWLVKQTFDELNLSGILEDIGLNKKQAISAQLLLTAKLVHPSSELEAQRWLNENSAAAELYDDPDDMTRYRLYQAGSEMYRNKTALDKGLYDKIGELFPSRAKIVIYDLTNIYFEGQMKGSDKADFGRSKQKRNDRRLIGLALSIDEIGFVRSSRFYEGNVNEPGTFIDLINDLAGQLANTTKKPLIVMDAGISTDDNLAVLRSEEYKYDYVCVSRTKPKSYIKLMDKATIISDNRGHKIELTRIKVEGQKDSFLHIKSDQKEKKEISMDKKLSARLVKQLQEIRDKLTKKGTLKKITKIHEKVGGIKAKLARVGYLYDITYTEDKEKGVVTDIQWKRIKSKEKPKGQYFLRYTLSAYKEDEIWDLYNLTRDVESVFRCLKSDLDIRPIYHQKDKYIEPHIWLGIVAYQVVNYIRRNLAKNKIHDSWSTIINKMSSMQSSITTVTNDKNQQLYIKLCTRPTLYQKTVFQSMGYKLRPFTRKIKVVTQL